MFKHSKLAAGLAIVAAAVIGSAGVALADGYAAKPVYAAPADWSGVYFGIDSGYQWSSIETRNPVNGIGETSDHNDWLVGGHIGVQHQWGLLVLGIEGGWQSSFFDRDGSNGVGNGGGCGTTFNCTARLNDMLTVGGRAGWSLGHWMPYITGGFANAGYDWNVRARTVAGTLTETAHERLDGWYLGGGFEWTVAPMWTLGLEYRHYDFDPKTTTSFNPATGAAIEPTRFDATTDSIMTRVSWRWGREPAAAPLK